MIDKQDIVNCANSEFLLVWKKKTSFKCCWDLLNMNDNFYKNLKALWKIGEKLEKLAKRLTKLDKIGQFCTGEEGVSWLFTEGSVNSGCPKLFPRASKNLSVAVDVQPNIFILSAVYGFHLQSNILTQAGYSTYNIGSHFLWQKLPLNKSVCLVCSLFWSLPLVFNLAPGWEAGKVAEASKV